MWGERLKQLQVQVDPERMRRHGVTLNEVEETAAERWTRVAAGSSSAKTQTVGFIETLNQRMYIRPVSPGVTPEGWPGCRSRRRTAARSRWATWWTWCGAAAADRRRRHQRRRRPDADRREVPWANTLEVTQGWRRRSTSWPGLPTIEIDHEIFRPATFIEDSIHNLTVALLVGAVLVVLVLGAFLYEWRWR